MDNKHIYLSLCNPVIAIPTVFTSTDLCAPIPLIGVGNGNPLQRSCLENPMNQGAW